MSDSDGASVVNSAEVTGGDPKPAEVAVDSGATNDGETLGAAGIKALNAERDARAAAEKLAKEYETKLQEFEDANKSEAEKAEAELQRRLADLDARDASLAAQEYELLKRSVATSKGLPADLADRLQGDDRKALEKDADALLALVVPSGEPRKPKPVANLGNDASNPSAKEQFASLMQSYL